MSFKFNRSAKDRAATKFMSMLNTALAHAAINAKGRTGKTQRDLAAALDMDKATVSRVLSGRGNPTARTIGEFFWALGVEPELVLHDVKAGHNHITPGPVAVAEAAAIPPAKRIPTGRANHPAAEVRGNWVMAG